MYERSNASAPDTRDADQLSGGMKGFFKVLRGIEIAGNKLPHPFWLFWILSGILALISWLLSSLNASAINPTDGKEVVVKNLLSGEGIKMIFESALDNFAGFAPLATIVTVLLGVAVAEHTGMLKALLRSTVVKVPTPYVTLALAFAGTVSHIAGDAAYIVLIPLGALLFKAVGKSPVIGVVVAFVSISAGYDASPLITTTDVLLSGLTTAAAQTVDAGYVVSPLANYFFSLASSVVLSIAITLVVEFVLARRPDAGADADAPGADDGAEDLGDLTMKPEELRGLRNVLIVFLAFIAVIVLAMIPGNSPLRGEDGAIVQSTLFSGVAFILGIMFTLLGYVYGKTAGTLTSAREVPAMMADGLRTLAPILVLFFAISQFLGYFKWTGLSTVLAVHGSETLQSLNAHPLLILAGVIVMVTLINLVVTSGSAQWALVAPVIVPMLMYLDISPETTQAVYRIADSCTNAITPMSPYFVMALGFLQRYKKNAGIGTLLSFTLPLVIVMLVVWCLLFAVWYLLGIDLGPGAPVR
ncbi:AbgT family transporter [Saxibacter everestensis]|uniref:AbgT family transporter n=1 Tax=Saxibacter everestensis TaxID=2909229 RepID=A0ABY8QT53_9MICO|nr:AbgT family transporter [Brevibacteriaceae bacterium ZFBP1038]